MQQTEAPVSYSKLFKLYSIMAHVVRATDLTPRMRRVTLGGEGLRSLAGSLLPADAIKLSLPHPGQPAPHARFFDLPTGNKPYAVRAYTVRRFDHEMLELDVDILVHGDSPGSVWARSAQPGDPIGFIGPRHDYRAPHGADWQLFAGDESALPAIASMLEQLPAGTRAHAFLEVNDKQDELPIHAGAGVEIEWLYRTGVPAKDSRLIEAALGSLSLPGGRGYCWVAGNSAVVRSIRRLLLQDWRLGKEQMFTMGYWS